MDNRNKDTESGLRFVNPPGLYNPAPNGYSHLALFPKGWRIILPAGQGGETEDQVLSEDALIGFRGLMLPRCPRSAKHGYG